MVVQHHFLIQLWAWSQCPRWLLFSTWHNLDTLGKKEPQWRIASIRLLCGHACPWGIFLIANWCTRDHTAGTSLGTWSWVMQRACWANQALRLPDPWEWPGLDSINLVSLFHMWPRSVRICFLPWLSALNLLALPDIQFPCLLLHPAWGHFHISLVSRRVQIPAGPCLRPLSVTSYLMFQWVIPIIVKISVK